MKTVAFFLTLAFLFGAVVYSQACSCMRTHPQDHYCRADFVILARVKREHINEKTHMKTYKVRVKKEFKVSEKALLALKSGRIQTSINESMCGINLELGKLYVLSGNIYSLRAHVGLCNSMFEKWEKVTKRQRKGLRLMYKHGCSCEITNCMYHRCYRQRNSCNWTNNCETKEGICLRQSNNSCMWNRNRALTTCTKELRRNSTRRHY